MTTMVFPASTSLSRTWRNLRTSSKWSPVVGSSSTYSVRPVCTLASSRESFTRCASPPLIVVAFCPRLMYPRPTSASVSSVRLSAGYAEKSSRQVSTLASSTSAMLSPL